MGTISRPPSPPSLVLFDSSSRLVLFLSFVCIHIVLKDANLTSLNCVSFSAVFFAFLFFSPVFLAPLPSPPRALPASSHPRIAGPKLVLVAVLPDVSLKLYYLDHSNYNTDTRRLPFILLRSCRLPGAASMMDWSRSQFTRERVILYGH